MHCRMVSSIPGLYLLDACITPPLSPLPQILATKNASRYCQIRPGITDSGEWSVDQKEGYLEGADVTWEGGCGEGWWHIIYLPQKAQVTRFKCIQ